MGASGFPGRVFPYPGNLQAMLHEINRNMPFLRSFGATGTSYYVDPTNGSNGNNDGRSLSTAFATITYALTKVVAGDSIFCAPGSYDESPTVARTDTPTGAALNNITIVGLGGRGAAYIEPSTEDADGLTVNADDVTLINLGCAAEDDTAGNYALIVTGSRFRAYGCKFEGGEQQVRIGPGTVAQEAAGTHGHGGDAIFEDCEIAWGTYGFVVVCTDYGAATQILVKNCRFHNIVTACVFEVVGSGGAADVLFRNFELVGNFFDDSEGGTAPTFYCDLNGDNGNDGIVAGNWFPTAINGGKNLVSTAMHWVSNYHTGGVSTGQPS